MKDPAQLISDYFDNALTEAGISELNAWLNADASHMQRFTEAAIFEQQIREAVLKKAQIPVKHASPIARHSAEIKVHSHRTRWLAHAAAWVGAFTILGNSAKATTTSTSATTGTTIQTQSTIAILMKKTITSVTAAILLLGGSGIYMIHRSNESSRHRVETMENEIQSLSNQLGIKSTSVSNRRVGATNAPKTVSVVQILAVYEGDNIITRQEKAILDEFNNQLDAMDAEALKNLLLDAEKLSSPINDRLARAIMEVLVRKDPAVATQIASQLIGRSSEFLFQMSHSAAQAFDAWLTKDPAAADAWYVATAASGGLNGKSIPMNGLEDLAIDRSFARSRFTTQLRVNPAEAAAMLATMLPADVTAALKSVTDPDALRHILPKLSPEQKGPAAEGAIKAMAANDPNAAFTWAKSLGMGDQERDNLMATGIEAAVSSGKLNLAGVAEWSKNLDLAAKTRSKMLVSAATSVSLIPRENENRIDVNNSVVWDRVAERIDWLRKEAPADAAEKMVGDYLGNLSYRSHNLDKSLEAYQNEVTKLGRIDPDLTIAFAFHLQIQQNDRAKAAALKLLNTLPPSEKRDHAIRTTELNR